MARSVKTLRAANGTAIAVSGEIEANVTFQYRLKTKIHFVVSEEIGEVILGAEFLTKHRCVIDFNQYELQLGQYNLELIQKNGRLNVNRIVTTEQTVLEPHSVQYVKAGLLVEEDRKAVDKVWMVEHRQLKPGIYIARSLHYSNEPETVLQVINTSDKTYTLPADQTLGQLDPIETVPPQFKVGADAEVWNDKIEKLVEAVAPDINEVDRNRLKELLSEFGDIFSQNPEDIGRCGILKHRLYTTDTPPL